MVVPVGLLDFQGETHTDPLIYLLITFHQCLQMRTSPISHLWKATLYHVLMLSKFIVKVLLIYYPSKSHGLGNLLAHFSKEASPEIAPALALIFQALLDQGTLPEVWRQFLV